MRSETRALILIVLAACILRLYLSSATVYLWDEERDWIPTAERISLTAGNVYLPVHEGQHSSFTAYLLRLSSVFFGRTPLGYRVLSIAAGVLAVLCIYGIALQWQGAQTATWAAALLAFNEYHINLSSLAVTRSFYLLFFLLAMYAFTRFLWTERPRYLYLAGASAGLSFLCTETAILLLPVCLAALLLFPRYRHWLRKKESYLACLIFLAVISPDILWNLKHPVAGPGQASYLDRLAQIGTVGFSRQPILFYARDAARALYDFLGRRLWDEAREYATMSSLFGAVLLSCVAHASLTRKRWKDPIAGFLLLIFWVVFGFFTLRRPSARPAGLDVSVWFWVDVTLFSAVLLAARYFAELSHKWRFLLYIVLGIAMGWACIGVGVNHLGRPQMAVGLSPEFLWPADGRMVRVQAKFIFCDLCDKQPKIELMNIQIHHADQTFASGVGSADVVGAELFSDDREFGLRAAPESGDTLAYRVYAFTYRVTDRWGRSHMLEDWAKVPRSSSQIFVVRPWAR